MPGSFTGQLWMCTREWGEKSVIISFWNWLSPNKHKSSPGLSIFSSLVQESQFNCFSFQIPSSFTFAWVFAFKEQRLCVQGQKLNPELSRNRLQNTWKQVLVALVPVTEMSRDKKYLSAWVCASILDVQKILWQEVSTFQMLGLSSVSTVISLLLQNSRHQCPNRNQSQFSKF